MTRKDIVKPALKSAKKKVSSNNWSFASAHVKGDDNNDGTGRFMRDMMLCFKQHGVLALIFHGSFDSRIVCSKCFQFMKPGSFALHCEKCNKQDAPTKEEIEKWRDSDRKWANLKRCDKDIFVDKKSIWVATLDAYVATGINNVLMVYCASGALVKQMILVNISDEQQRSLRMFQSLATTKYMPFA